jgi:outer membrane protein assembly factor BamD
VPFPFLRFLSPFGLFLTLALFAMGSLAGCASTDKDKLDERPAEELYQEALQSLQRKEYKAATEKFEEVERQHPYSIWATRGQVMSAFAQYQAMEYAEAITILERFIQLHPGNSNAGYAYYMRALCYYEQIADVRRDQSVTDNALSALQDVISRFPDSTYAKDAVLKISLISDHLAGHEMEIGRYYLTRKLPNSAIGRFKRVVEKYQRTSHVPEALHRLVESYLALGIEDEAKATAAVLGFNFPGSPWYQDSYALLKDKSLLPEPVAGSWISQVWQKLL